MASAPTGPGEQRAAQAQAAPVSRRRASRPVASYQASGWSTSLSVSWLLPALPERGISEEAQGPGGRLRGPSRRAEARHPAAPSGAAFRCPERKDASGQPQRAGQTSPVSAGERGGAGGGSDGSVWGSLLPRDEPQHLRRPPWPGTCTPWGRRGPAPGHSNLGSKGPRRPALPAPHTLLSSLISFSRQTSPGWSRRAGKEAAREPRAPSHLTPSSA